MGPEVLFVLPGIISLQYHINATGEANRIKSKSTSLVVDVTIGMRLYDTISMVTAGMVPVAYAGKVVAEATEHPDNMQQVDLEKLTAQHP